ncbi:MAG: DNA polymerase III subunit beta [Clostridia bacterium]|nr:DNA polymerase III subunit beta [Clostridia bacterium]
MKISADKQTLLGAIVPASGFASRKGTIDVVEGILFNTVGTDKCEVKAYDLEKGFVKEMGCRVDEPGCYSINAPRLVQVIKTMPEGTISIAVNEKNLRVIISGGRSVMELSALPGDKFPLFPDFVGDRAFRISQKSLKNMFSKTQFAIAENSEKPELNGLFFKVNKEEIAAVSCDRNRIAIYSEKNNLTSTGEKELNFSVIIPGKSVAEVIRFLNDTDKEIKVIIGIKHVIFMFDNFTVFTRVIDANYLDYERFLPKAPKTFVTLNSNEIISSLERAMFITEEKIQGQIKPAVICDFKQDMLTLFSQSTVGRINDEIPTEHDGDEIEIGFNCRLLYDAIKNTDTENVKLSLTSPLMGMLIEPLYETQNRHFTMLVLPVRLP